MTCHFVHELLQAFSPVLDEFLLEQTLVAPEWHLPLPRLAGQWWHDNLTVTFQFASQPLKVAISSAYTRLLLLEDGQI